MNRRPDVIIVGAGPAGSSLALRLARAGRTCLLVDGAGFPRDKVCGEGIMPAGLEVLGELGLRDALQAQGQPFRGIRYRLGDGTQAEAHFPGEAAALGLRRHTLDAALVGAVQSEPNAEVRLGSWVRTIEHSPDGPARVQLDGGWVEAPLLVGADGCRSRIRRTAGLDAPPPRRVRFGVRAHFTHPPRSTPRPVVEVFVGSRFELYTTPVAADTTCVALLCEASHMTGVQGRLEEGMRDALETAGGRCAVLARAPRTGRVQALGPLGLEARAAHAERLLLVGDAAGALDPITGEGVALALVTGAIAAEVVQASFAANDFSAGRLKEWTRRRRRAVRGISALTSFVLHLSAHPARARRVVRNLGRSPRTFQRLLAVAAGLAPPRSLGLRDGLGVALGV